MLKNDALAESALRAFVDVIDNVGVFEYVGGDIEPCFDQRPDLFGYVPGDIAKVMGRAYVDACEALGRLPVWGPQQQRVPRIERDEKLRAA